MNNCQPQHQKSHNLNGWRGGNGGEGNSTPCKNNFAFRDYPLHLVPTCKNLEIKATLEKWRLVCSWRRRTPRSIPKFSPIIYHFPGGKGRPSTQVQSHGERGNPFSCVPLNTSVFTLNRAYRYYACHRR